MASVKALKMSPSSPALDGLVMVDGESTGMPKLIRRR